jgi:hypothetical protein
VELALSDGRLMGGKAGVVVSGVEPVPTDVVGTAEDRTIVAFVSKRELE